MVSFSVFGHRYLNARRAQQMSRVIKDGRYAVARLNRLFVIRHPKPRHKLMHIVKGIHRRVSLLTGALCPTVLPSRFRFLNMRRIGKHNGAQVVRSRRCIYVPAKAVFNQQRKLSGMIDMCMCEKYKVNGGGRHGKLTVFINIRPLLHAAVYENLFAAGFKQGT